ncbi:MAG: TonB-dependent receptor [Undibacterium sp.]|uniref:TonB-dependent receptor domain-containing protein n=1 Tax=Undibacterium sp. TaxID=1914977 RepID=UPI00271629C6|nr:TonB-dependent receptor [Undibacterium sp.]MDO8653932.1 TonB-dependent receptor [Undibacterium sp.]
MKFQLKSMPMMIAQVIASGALSVIAIPAVMAQEASTADAPQRVTITGSMISRANKETPSPVQILSADDLVKSGFTTVTEVLTNLASNGAGSLGQGFAGAFAGGASGVSLRGLTVGSTLVLIDGHRMSPFPIGDDAQRQFVDVSNIPFDMVERIEVLKDGASSVYGSDAIAGVVNVILKKTFNGTRISAEGGTTQHGGGKNVHATISHGMGNLNNDGYNVFGSLEYRKSDPIKVSQRDNNLWASSDWTSRGGVDRRLGVPNSVNGGRTATNTPFFFDQTGAGGANNAANFTFATSDCDYAKYKAAGCVVRDTYANLSTETENINVLVGLTKSLPSDWLLNLKGSVFSSENKNNRGAPAVFSAGSYAGNTSLIPGQAPALVNVVPSFLVPATYPGNPYGKAVRIYGYIPEIDASNTQDTTSKAVRFAADLSGTVSGWDVNAALGMSQVTTDVAYSGYINRPALYAALNRANNPFKVTGGNTAADLEAISPHFSKQATSKLSYADLRFGRELMTLPGGALGLSTGVSFIHKNIDSPSALLLQTGLVGNGGAYSFGVENNSAAFVEMVAPVLKNLELDVSGRFDHFDTYGNSSTPKVGFKYAPHETVTVRGTYSRGFRAPNSAENGTAGSSFSSGGINDPILCPDGKTTTAGNVVSACNFTPAYVQTTTKDLQPEKSTSATFGLILEPVKGWATTIDYYQVEINGQVNTESLLPNFKPNFVRGPILDVVISDGGTATHIGPSSVGSIVYATSGYVNVGSTRVKGIDIDTSYKFKLGEYGTLKTTLQYSHQLSFLLTFLDQKYELAGTHGPSGVSGDTGNPKNRANLSFGYDKGPLNVTTTFNWVGSYSALDPSVGANECKSAALDVAGRNYFGPNDVPAAFCKIASFMSTNMTATYKLGKNWTLNAAVTNMFDRQPPIDVATYGNAGNVLGYNANLHQAGVNGRAFNIGAAYRF